MNNTIDAVKARLHFIEGWDALEREVEQINQDHGWHDTEVEDGTRIALMHSELSEALEGLRHGNGPSDHIPEFNAAEEELADVVIRVMDMAKIRGWNLPAAILAKIEFNRNRPHKHGGKKF